MDFNYYSYSHSTEKQRKIIDRYMYYIYKCLAKEDWSYYEFSSILTEANIKIREKIFKKGVDNIHIPTL